MLYLKMNNVKMVKGLKQFEVADLAEKRNIVKYKNTYDFNIGLIIFAIIIIYVLFNVFSYFTKSTVAEYEVQQGTIASNHVYQGVIIRDETVEYATKDGFVNYYVKNASKVSTTDIVYSVDTVGTVSDEISSIASGDFTLPADTMENLSKNVNTFMKTYDSNTFYECYDFLDDLNSEITHTINNTILNDLSSKVTSAEEDHTFFKFTSSSDGIIVYYTDGYETKTIDEYVKEGLSFTDYKKNVLDSNREVAASDPVYKRINSENWNILISIDRELARELNEGSVVKIRFCKDDFTTNATYTVVKNGDNYYLNLALRTAMIRYANERLVDIELVVKDTTGLKIPKTSITEKEFFTIPKEYFTVGGDSNKSGILVKHQEKGNDSVASFVTPTIYYETEDYYYIDSENVSAGDTILKENSVASYVIGSETDLLIGVYNINKGYAVFKQINIIYENEEYAIVETKTAYGISLYDHIALDASKVTENQLTTK